MSRHHPLPRWSPSVRPARFRHDGLNRVPLWIRLALLLLLAGASLCQAAALPSTEPLTLAAARKEALRGNPGLAQMRARAAAMAAIPSQVGTLPDPVLSFNAMNLPTDTFDLNQEPMTQLQLGVSQMFPFPGKLALREEAAAFEADAATNNVEETRLRLIREVKSTWWLLFYLDRALEIVAANQELLRQFVEIAQTKYKVGQGLQQDVLLAQLELSRLLDQEIQLQALRQNEAARLNALLDRPADQTLSLPPTASSELPEIAPEPALFTTAESTRPQLMEQRRQIDAAASRVRLAQKDFFPDLTVGAFYGFREGDNPPPRGDSRADFFSLRLSMNVPVFAHRKQAKAVDQRTSELLQQRYSLQDQWGRIRAEISGARADYHRAKQQFILFQTGIVPQARQTVASMLAGYQVNKVDFLNLVRSQITLINYETQSWRALSEAHQALARLVAAVGSETIYE